MPNIINWDEIDKEVDAKIEQIKVGSEKSTLFDWPIKINCANCPAQKNGVCTLTNQKIESIDTSALSHIYARPPKNCPIRSGHVVARLVVG